MRADIAAARALRYDTARGWDPPVPGPAAEAFTAKLVASEMLRINIAQALLVA